MIIDSHCHLDSPDIYDQLDDVIKRAKSNLVDYLLTISTTLDSFEKIKLIVKKYKNIYGTLGIHPHEVKNFADINSNFLKKLQKESKKIIGIGETGLDYHYNYSEKSIQRRVFVDHIEAAIDLELPVIVHTRNAEKDTLDILKSCKNNSNLKILIHCFTGSREFAKKLLDIGSFISVSGIITFKNSYDLADAVNLIPLDKLLVETDSPYLAPHPFRGKMNEPSYLKFTVDKLSQIKNLPKEMMMNRTSENFLKLFGLNFNVLPI